MRYDTKIYFWSNQEKKYNPHTHKYDTGTSKVDTRFANVTDLSTQKQVQFLGGIKTGTKTIRLITNDLPKWDYITLDSAGIGIKYRFVTSVEVLKGYAMIVGTDNG